MIMLDNTIVNVALPAIQSDLGTTISQLEWVVGSRSRTADRSLLVRQQHEPVAMDGLDVRRPARKLC
jgi:hypothetical protein